MYHQTAPPPPGGATQVAHRTGARLGCGCADSACTGSMRGSGTARLRDAMARREPWYGREMTRAVVWFKPWCGASHGMERAMVWREPWYGAAPRRGCVFDLGALRLNRRGARCSARGTFWPSSTARTMAWCEPWYAAKHGMAKTMAWRGMVWRGSAASRSGSDCPAGGPPAPLHPASSAHGMERLRFSCGRAAQHPASSAQARAGPRPAPPLPGP